MKNKYHYSNEDTRSCTYFCANMFYYINFCNFIFLLKDDLILFYFQLFYYHFLLRMTSYLSHLVANMISFLEICISKGNQRRSGVSRVFEFFGFYFNNWEYYEKIWIIVLFSSDCLVDIVRIHRWISIISKYKHLSKKWF